MDSTYWNYKKYISEGVLKGEDVFELIKESLESNWKADSTKSNDWAKRLTNEIMTGSEESYDVVEREVMTELLSIRKACPVCGN